MQHVQGYAGSLWMPPLVDYLLRIVPAATRATGKQTTMKKYTYFAGRFYGHGDAAYGLMEEVQASLEATGRCHWASICSNSSKGTYLCQVFLLFCIVNTLKMGAKQKDGP
jgi:hypothetical protein